MRVDAAMRVMIESLPSLSGCIGLDWLRSDGWSAEGSKLGRCFPHVDREHVQTRVPALPEAFLYQAPYYLIYLLCHVTFVS